MRNTKILITILVGIIALLVWIRFGYLPKSPDVELPGESVAMVSPSPTSESWPSFATDDFTLDYPKEASASAVDGGPDSIAWRINYMGEVQKASGRTQTELFDGYAVTLERFEVVGDNVALTQAKADRGGTIEACGEDNATEITELIFKGAPAFRYFGGCLGQAEMTYFVTNEYLYRISNFVAHTTDADALKYRGITSRIIESLRFTK